MIVQEITAEIAGAIVHRKTDELGYRPLGLFYFKSDDKWITFDNAAGECFVEEWRSKGAAVEWLKMGDPDRGNYETFFNAADISEPDVFERVYLKYMAQEHPGHCPRCWFEQTVLLKPAKKAIDSLFDRVLAICPVCDYKLYYVLRPAKELE